MASFEDFKLNKQLLSAIADLGYAQPTAIQNKAIPVIQAGHDVIGVAQTGTGKTAAYVLPLLMKLSYPQGVQPRALILAPTRELVIQIASVIGELSAYTDLRFMAVYGGVGMKTQIEQLSQGIDLLVATPGRLMDLYFGQHVVFKSLKTLVLDEADKMMDMGFMPQIRKILEIIPSKRQNLLFSATMPPKVEHLAEEFLEYPMQVEVAPQATTADTITQVRYDLPNLQTKIYFLEHLLQDEGRFTRVLVFARTRRNAENIYRFLSRKFGVDTIGVIHANKAQTTRIHTLEKFKAGNLRVVVATDVAARGIDVSLVSHVINFDVPLIYEDYVHRIGRTGRAEATGEAITFVTQPELYHVQKIEQIIHQKIPLVSLPEDVTVFPTPFEESQAMAKAIDDQKKKDDPTFKGAFHEKKRNLKQTFASKNRKLKNNKAKKRR